MKAETALAILVLALTLYFVRMLPLTLIRREIRSKRIQSFLYYVPYVTLTVMTFPAILNATDSLWSAMLGFLTAIVMAWRGKSLFAVAIGGCTAVFLLELLPMVG